MPLTVGQITDKISELRSKIAIHEAVALYLKTNYKPSSDSAPAEMHITRGDHATVPVEHIEAFLADAAEIVDQMRAELRQWETLPVSPPGEAPVEAPKVKIQKRKRGPRGPARRHQNQSASDDSGSNEAG